MYFSILYIYIYYKLSLARNVKSESLKIYFCGTKRSLYEIMKDYIDMLSHCFRPVEYFRVFPASVVNIS